MRCGRGFFRAWVVLSAIWVGLSVYIQEPRTYRMPSRATLTAPSGSKVEIDLSKGQAQLSDDVTELLKSEANRLKITHSSAADEKTQSLSEERDDLLKMIAAEHEKQRQKVWTAWFITIAPPLAVLVLGICIAWILRGFRTTA
jgi:hypothetical protein